MSAAYVQVAPDSTGKKILTFEAVVGGNTVEAQSVVHVNSSGAEIVTQQVNPVAASNTWGQALTVTSAATATLAHIASSAAGYEIRGFVVHGTGDGYFFVQVNSVTILSGRTRSTLPLLSLTLPNGVAVDPASDVALKVTNESGSTADFEGTLLGA